MPKIILKSPVTLRFSKVSLPWPKGRRKYPCLRGLVGYTSDFKSDFPHSCEFKSRSNCIISISMWNTAYATTYVLYNTLTATALTEK